MLGIRIMCPDDAICLPADCYFNENPYVKIQRSDLVQSGYRHLTKFNLFSPWCSWKICLFCVKQQSLTHPFMYKSRDILQTRGPPVHSVLSASYEVNSSPATNRSLFHGAWAKADRLDHTSSLRCSLGGSDIQGI